MNLLFALALLLVLSILSGIATSSFKKTIILDSLLIFRGLLIIFIFNSIIAWTIGFNSHISLLGMLSLLLIGIFRIAKNKITKVSNSVKYQLIIIIYLTFLFVLANFTTHRYFINPDPYGYLSLAGGLSKYGSISEITNHWSQYSGIKFTSGMNWDIGSNRLKSLWDVPDLRLKYAADALNIPRIAISSLLAGLFLVHSLKFILSFWLGLSIFAIGLLGGLLIQIIEELNSKNGSIFDSQKVKHKISFTFSISIYLFVTLLLISNLIFKVMMLEGFAAQLISYSSIPAVILIFIKLYKQSINWKTFSLYFSIIVVGTYFLYPQQTPYIFFVSIPISLLFYFKDRNLRETFLLLSTSIVVGLFTIFTPGTLYLLKQIKGSTGHGSVHLGSLSLTNLVSPVGLSNISEPVVKQGQIFSGTLSTQWSIGNPAIGYRLFDNSLNYLFLQLILVLFFITAITFYNLKKSNFSISERLIFITALWFSNAMWIIYLIYYLYSHVYILFSNAKSGKQIPSDVFSDYVWLRLLGLEVVLLMVYLSTLITPLNFRRKNHKKTLISAFFVILVLVSSITFYRDINIFRKNSLPGTTIANCDKVHNNPLILWKSDRIGQTAMALNLCEGKFIAPQDFFETVIPADGRKHQILLIDQISSDYFQLKKIGELILENEIHTPCDLKCILEKNKIIT